MKKLFFLILVIGSVELFAQSAPKFSNEFLSIGVGARALGMSNAYVTSVNDVTSGYWNPSGLMGIEKDFQVGLMHAEYFAGIAKYDYGAFAAKIDTASAFGFSLIRFRKIKFLLFPVNKGRFTYLLAKGMPEINSNRLF